MLGCIDGTISLALDQQGVRLYFCVLAFQGVILVQCRGPDVTLIYYIDDGRCAFVVVGCMDGTTSSVPHSQLVRLCAWYLTPVLLFGFGPIISS